MLTIDQIANFSKGILLQGYTASDTTVSFIPTDWARFPDPADGAYNVVWWNNTDYADPADDPQVEIVRVVSGAADVKVIQRAQEGTAATDKNIPNKTYKMVLSLTTKMIYDIVNQAGTGTVESASNEGGAFQVFDPAASTDSNLVFKTIAAGANVTITDIGGVLTIASSGGGGGGLTGVANVGAGSGIFRDITGGATINLKTLIAGTNVTFTVGADSITINATGGGGSGYNLIQNNGVSVTAETTINLSTLLVASDVGGKTALTINTTGLAADSTFITALVANTSFINSLTSSTLFQTNINNFISGGSGGTKLAIDTTAFSVTNGTGAYSTAFTIPIPGGTLGTNDAIRFSLMNTNFTAPSGIDVHLRVKYGGTIIGTLNFNTGGSGLASNSIAISGLLTADGSANAQISLIGSTSAISALQTSVVGSAAVDSTVSQNLVIEIAGQGGSSVIQNIDGIVVEKISLGGGGGSTSVAVIAGNSFTGLTTPVPVVFGDGVSYRFFGFHNALPGFTRVLGDASARTAYTYTFKVKDGNKILVDKIDLWIDGVVGSPAPIIATIETTSGGNPTGVVLGTTLIGYSGAPAYSSGNLASVLELSAPTGGGDVTYAIVFTAPAISGANYYSIGTENAGGVNSAPFLYDGATWSTSGQQPATSLYMTYVADRAYTAAQTPVSSLPRMISVIVNSGGGLPYPDTIPTVLQTVLGFVNINASLGDAIRAAVSGAVTGYTALDTVNLYYCDRSDGHVTTSSSNSTTRAGRALTTTAMGIIPQ